MHIQMPANRLLYKKRFHFPCISIAKNGRFYPNLGFHYISFGKGFFITVLMGYNRCSAIKIMQFTETLFSIIL